MSHKSRGRSESPIQNNKYVKSRKTYYNLKKKSFDFMVYRSPLNNGSSYPIKMEGVLGMENGILLPPSSIASLQNMTSAEIASMVTSQQLNSLDPHHVIKREQVEHGSIDGEDELDHDDMYAMSSINDNDENIAEDLSMANEHNDNDILDA